MEKPDGVCICHTHRSFLIPTELYHVIVLTEVFNSAGAIMMYVTAVARTLEQLPGENNHTHTANRSLAAIPTSYIG